MSEFSDEYNVLPYQTRFSLPNFRKSIEPSTVTFAPSPVECEKWYELFICNLKAKIGKTYYPICRLSDGEFTFMFGKRPPYDNSIFKASTLKYYAKKTIKKILSLNKKNGFQAFTGKLYHSGAYTEGERKDALPEYFKQLKGISVDGVLALHLSYNSENPFQEHFFPDIKNWNQQASIIFDTSNYVPFYFVYAMFGGSDGKEILKDRNVLVAHGATGKKKENIIQGLLNDNAKHVEWLQISDKRTLLEKIDVSPFLGKVDIVLVGAGIGKPNIFEQLKPLNVPCIDPGYYFEVWNDPDMKWGRVMCYTDEEYDEEKIKVAKDKLYGKTTRIRRD